MAKKSDKAFITHVNNARATVQFHGIITKFDIAVLKQKYHDLTAKEFDDYAIKYLKRKKEEN